LQRQVYLNKVYDDDDNDDDDDDDDDGENMSHVHNNNSWMAIVRRQISLRAVHWQTCFSF